MEYEVVKVEENEVVGFNVYVKRVSDGKVVMCDEVMNWDDEVLEDMFMMVEEGEW